MKDRFKKTFWLLIPILIFFLFQCYIQFPPKDIEICNAVFSIIWMETLSLFLILVSGRVKIPLVVLSLFFMILGLAENYVYRFRAFFLTPTDLLSAGTAMNVAGNYDFTPPPEVLFITCLFLALIILVVIFCPARLEITALKSAKARAVSALLFLALFFGLTEFVRHYPADPEGDGILKISDNAFHSFKNNKNEGAIIRLLYDSGYMFVKKPAGYSGEEASSRLEDFEGEGEIPSKEDLPDIIVIMNESFADPKVDGPLETNVDYMPFVHSLQEGEENTITGTLNVSIQGANTPNTEFEFLTGSTLAFLPEGSIPFQQYITKDIDAMPRYLSTIGYDTVAMHPYLSNGWNRTRAYPALGFEDMKFLEYFEDKDPEYVREYITDSFFFRKITEEVDSRNSDGPVFSFNVTMQNHGSYTKEFDNFNKDVQIIEDERTSHADKLETYLSLVKLSDEAFKEMVEHYKNTDRKTLLVFFGDHQPATVNLEPVFHALGTDRRNLSEETEKAVYKVPFVIWANYDIAEGKDIETSVNFFGNLVLKEAGIPLDPYRSFTESLSEELPVISAVRISDSKGNDLGRADAGEDFKEYERLQYYELFDRKIGQ